MRLQLLLDAAEEDTRGIIDRIIEYGRLLACLGDEAVVAIEKLDAGDDNAHEQREEWCVIPSRARNLPPTFEMTLHS